jgi:hypothetical protein
MPSIAEIPKLANVFIPFEIIAPVPSQVRFDILMVLCIWKLEVLQLVVESQLVEHQREASSSCNRLVFLRISIYEGLC